MSEKIIKLVPIILVIVGLFGLSVATDILPLATTSFTVTDTGVKNVEILDFTHTDVNGGEINPGDSIRFTGNIRNSGSVDMYGYYAMLFAATDGQVGYIIPDTDPANLAVGAVIPIDVTWTVPELASYPGSISTELVWVDSTNGFIYFSIINFGTDDTTNGENNNLLIMVGSVFLILLGLFLYFRKK